MGRPIEASFRVEPLVVRAGQESIVTIKPMGRQARFEDGVSYTVRILPMELLRPENYNWPLKFDTLTLQPEDGKLVIHYTFTEEQEWKLLVAQPDNKDWGRLRFHVYSVEDDLYGLHPYRGDLHSHSSRSDGRDDPAVVAANYRSAGFDFFALTDHYKWHPSQEMMDDYKDVKLGIKLFHGEEVHLRQDYIIHIVNFGGDASVYDMYKADPDKAESEIAGIAEKLTDLPYGVNPVEYARRVWVSERIRQVGGLCILAHPFWIAEDRYNMDLRMLDYCMRSGVYDAMEMLTGQTEHENNLQLAFYMEERAKGVNIPYVASSDSHGTEPACYFGTVKTLIFAKSTEKSDIFEAIKARRCVAIEQNPHEEYRAYGDFRMVKYARFLMRFYFPIHDTLCVEEGRLMKDYILGIEGAKEALESLHDRTEKTAEKLLGR